MQGLLLGWTPVLFLNGLVQKMKEGGHHIVVVIKERLEVMKMLEHVVLSEEMERKKAAKKLMTKEEKISYVMKWKKKNRLMLIEGGVWPPWGGDQAVVNPLKFLSGFIFLQHQMHRERSSIFRWYFKRYTHVMVLLQMAIHHQLHLKFFLGMKTRRVGYSSESLPRIFIMALSMRQSLLSLIKQRV